MKYIIIISIFFLSLILFYNLKKKKAIRKVKCSTNEEKLSKINPILRKFGFTFDLKQDIVISLQDGFQKNFGYSDFYDLNAISLDMIFDAEPIIFDYNDKEYRIEFWKGQYGITTGAEIGIYIHEYNMKEGIYRTALPSECLEMGFLLFKKCFLFARTGYAWWLTGFDIGNFSQPKDLKLRVFVKFPSIEMQKCFINALIKSGYTENKISVQGLCVYFEICCPHNYKLNGKKLKKFIINLKNYFNCCLFNHFTRYFPKTIDKLTYICYMFPKIYGFILKICFPKKKYHKIKKL